jgi:hypothetical protein
MSGFPLVSSPPAGVNREPASLQKGMALEKLTLLIQAGCLEFSAFSFDPPATHQQGSTHARLCLPCSWVSSSFPPTQFTKEQLQSAASTIAGVMKQMDRLYLRKAEELM